MTLPFDGAISAFYANEAPDDIREAIKKIPDTAAGKLPKFDGPLAAEMRALEAAKSLALLLFNRALIRYGQDLMNHQQLGELLSDVFTAVYAMDSILSRVRQNLKSNGDDEMRLKIARTFCAETLHQLGSRVERGILSLLSGRTLEENLKQVRALREQMVLAYDIFALKDEIAEDLYAHGQYRF